MNLSPIKLWKRSLRKIEQGRQHIELLGYSLLRITEMLRSITGLQRITKNTQVLLGYRGITDIYKYYWITRCI